MVCINRRTRTIRFVLIKEDGDGDLSHLSTFLVEKSIAGHTGIKDTLLANGYKMGKDKLLQNRWQLWFVTMTIEIEII